MNAYPNAPLAWDRTRMMARRLGVDLPHAVIDGWLTRRDIDSLVTTCAACGKATCGTVQPAASETPTCPNGPNLTSLRL